MTVIDFAIEKEKRNRDLAYKIHCPECGYDITSGRPRIDNPRRKTECPKCGALAMEVNDGLSVPEM